MCKTKTQNKKPKPLRSKKKTYRQTPLETTNMQQQTWSEYLQSRHPHKRRIREHINVIILRKRTASLTDSPPVANMQESMGNPGIPTKNIFANCIVTKIFPKKFQKHSLLTQRLKIQHQILTHKNIKCQPFSDIHTRRQRLH